MSRSKVPSRRSRPADEAGKVPSLLDAFQEWRRRCSLAACSDTAAGLLRQFAASRFDAFCRRYAPFPALRVPHPLTPPPADCWHLFETRLAVDRTRSGKRYKQWLFESARVGARLPLDRLTGGASLLMRDVVRAWLAHEAPHPRTDSLQAPIAVSEPGRPLTLEDLLPDEGDPAEEAARRDIGNLSSEIAGDLWPELDRRERIVLAARAAARPLSDPAVEQAAGCRKSMLYAALRSLMERLAAQLRRDHPSEEPTVLLAIARGILSDLARRALEWAISEKPPLALFSETRDRSSAKLEGDATP